MQEYNKSKSFNIVTFLFTLGLIVMSFAMWKQAHGAEVQFRGHFAPNTRPVECVTVSWDADGTKCNGIPATLERWTGARDVNNIKEYEGDTLTFTNGFPSVIVRYRDQPLYDSPDSKYGIVGIGWYFNEVPDSGNYYYLSAFENAALLKEATVVTPDYDAPNLSITPITSPISGITQLSATAIDDIGVTKVEFYVDSGIIQTITTAPYVTTFDASLLSNGDHTIMAIAYDASEKATTKEMVVTVHNNVAPTANAGLDVVVMVPTTSVTLVGTGTDSDGSIASYVWTQTAGAPATITTPVEGSSTIIGLVQGAYTFTLTVTDNQGAIGTDDVNITVNPDSIAPTVTLVNPKTGIVSGTKSRITATATDNVGITKVQFYAGAKLIGTELVVPFDRTWDTTKFVNGSYVITAKAYDAAGNVTVSAPISVIVKN